MAESVTYRRVLEEILNEPRESFKYKVAMQAVHQVQLFPNLKEKNPDFKLLIKQEGLDIYLTLEGRDYNPKKQYSPAEVEEIILNSNYHKEGKISPEEIASAFVSNLKPSMGEHLAEKELDPFLSYLTRL